MESAKEGHPPFQKELPIQDLLTSGVNMDQLHQLGEDRIIRRFPLEGLRVDDPETKVAIAERLRNEKIADSLFKKLQDLGINVVPYQRIVGHDLKKPAEAAVYTIVDKIDGKPLNQLSPEEIRTFSNQIDQTFEKLFIYLAGILSQGGVFHSELFATQFMAGTNMRKKDEGPKLFLTDIDPLCFEYKTSDSQMLLMLAQAILAPVGDIETLTNKSGVPLPRAYEAAKRAVKILALKNDQAVNKILNEMSAYGSVVVSEALVEIKK